MFLTSLQCSNYEITEVKKRMMKWVDFWLTFFIEKLLIEWLILRLLAFPPSVDESSEVW